MKVTKDEEVVNTDAQLPLPRVRRCLEVAAAVLLTPIKGKILAARLLSKKSESRVRLLSQEFRKKRWRGFHRLATLKPNAALIVVAAVFGRRSNSVVAPS